MSITLNNIYFRQSKEILEFKDIYLETSMGVLKLYVTSLDFINDINIQSMHRLLISGKFILGIEYVLNSNFKHSVQEFRIIEDINGLNKTELNDFKELDIVELPFLSR